MEGLLTSFDHEIDASGARRRFAYLRLNFAALRLRCDTAQSLGHALSLRD